MFSCIRLLKLMIFTRQIIYVCFKVHKYIYEYIYILVNRLTITIINKLQLVKSISYNTYLYYIDIPAN